MRAILLNISYYSFEERGIAYSNGSKSKIIQLSESIKYEDGNISRQMKCGEHWQELTTISTYISKYDACTYED